MAEREPLPPGQLPNIFDTNPPPLHPATEVGDGFVRVDETKLHPPKAEPEQTHERHTEQHPTGRTTTHTITVSRTSSSSH